MILHQGTKNYDHMFGCRVMAWRDKPFWTNFCHPSGNSKNSIFKKSLKNALLLKWVIMISYQCTSNYNHMMYDSGVMAWDRWSDGRKDGSKKWHTEMGATPKKFTLIHASNVVDAVEKADKKIKTIQIYKILLICKFLFL